jgi:hypothetical protein
MTGNAAQRNNFSCFPVKQEMSVKKEEGIKLKDLKEVKEFFEAMIASKYPTIASGDTPIGSTDRAPDEDINIDLISNHRIVDDKFDSSLPLGGICN